MKGVIAVDLDGVLCEEGGWMPEEIMNREPILENIKKVNKLFDEGYFIIIYTGRRKEDEPYTRAWLEKHGVKYDIIVFEKPRFDAYIDEKKKLWAIEELGGEQE